MELPELIFKAFPDEFFKNENPEDIRKIQAGLLKYILDTFESDLKSLDDYQTTLIWFILFLKEVPRSLVEKIRKEIKDMAVHRAMHVQNDIDSCGRVAWDVDFPDIQSGKA